MSEPMNHRSCLTVPVSCLLPLTLLCVIVIGSLGCAQAESNNWAQTSPLIEPDQRATASYHLGAHDDVIHSDNDEDDADG